MTKVTIGGAEREVQRFSLCKALRAITLLNVIQKLVPDGAEQLGEFVGAYRKAHVEVLDRVQAKLRYGGEIPVIEEGRPVLKADGQLLTVKAPIEQLTEQDWERAGQAYRRPEDPPVSAMVASIFPTIAESAEEPLLRLLAVCIIDNDDFLRYVKAGNWQEEADAVAEKVLQPAPLEDVIDLCVAVGDVLEGSVLNKLSEVADKSGNLLARLGIRLPGRAEPEEPTPSSESAGDSSPSGSTSSASDMEDGDPETSGASPGTRPSPSESAGESAPSQTSSSEPALPLSA